MKARIIVLGLLVAAMLSSAGAASAFDANSKYTLRSTGIDPNFTIRRNVSWSDHSVVSTEWLGVLNIEVWALGMQDKGSIYHIGDIKTLCIDLDHTVYVPGTWEATYRIGIGGSDKPYGLKGTDAENAASWNRLTYAISHNGDWFNSGSAEQKAAMQLVAWELINGDSVSGADSSWATSGDFKVSAAGPVDRVLDEANRYLDSTKNIGSWSGAGFGWWSSVDRQDQIAIPAVSYQYTPVRPVPETNTLVGFGAALAINGIGVAGSGYYLRRRYNKASARNYANRHISTMSLYLDTAVSMVVLISVSPILVALAAAGALKTDKPAVFGAKIKY